MKKKLTLIILSVVMVVCVALGLTACGKKPQLSVDTQSLDLLYNEEATVTATVTNSKNVASFSSSDPSVVVVQTEENANETTVKAVGKTGSANIVVKLEGVNEDIVIPVNIKGEYEVNATNDLDRADKVLDAKVTGEDDGETAEITVRHFIPEVKKVEYAVEGNALTYNVDNGKLTIKAHQAGVATVTVNLMKEKPADPAPENPPEETQADEPTEEEPTDPEIEYVPYATKVYNVVCTDDYNDLATEQAELANYLGYKEVKGEEEKVIGYKAYILDTADPADLDGGKLYVPAIHNRLPVLGLVGRDDADGVIKYFAAVEVGQVKTPEQIEALEGEEKDAATAKNALIAKWTNIYDAVKEVYLPCTLTKIDDLAFRLAKVVKVDFQLDSNVEELGIQSFNEAYYLESVNLENLIKLKTIKNNAFDNAGSKVKLADDQAEGTGGFNLTMPASLELIELQAFANSGLRELRFLDDGNPDTGVTLGTMLFLNGKIEKLWLANIKNVQNQAFWLTGTLKELHIDANTTPSDINPDQDAFATPGVLSGSYMGFAGFGFTGAAWNAVTIYLEGDNAIAKQVDRLKNGYAAALGDNCGALFGSGLNAGFHCIYISTDTATSEIATYLANFFKRSETQDKDGYVRYDWKKFCWEVKDPTQPTIQSGVDYDETAKFEDPAPETPETPAE